MITHRPYHYVQAIKRYEQESYAAYETITGETLERKPDGTLLKDARNNALDAFRHAFASTANYNRVTTAWDAYTDRGQGHVACRGAPCRWPWPFYK